MCYYQDSVLLRCHALPVSLTIYQSLKSQNQHWTEVEQGETHRGQNKSFSPLTNVKTKQNNSGVPSQSSYASN